MTTGSGSGAGMFKALRGDFQLSSMVLFCVVACAIIVPFAIFRTWHGDYAIAALDVGIILILSGTVFYAWRSRNYHGAVAVILLTIVVGSVLITYLLGRAGLLWTYPVMLVSFFVAPKRWALAAAVATTISVIVLGYGFDSGFERFTYAATSGLSILLAFIFARRAAQQRAQLETLASYDPLTGVGNRRLMEQDLTHEVSTRCSKRGMPGLALLDLDHFKRVNDQHGHEAGDQVLIAFAGLVRSTVRKPDRLYRFGGEEFVLLLPSVTQEGLLIALEKVRRQIEAVLRSPDAGVTVSIGAALLTENEDWPGWLARADAALYRAKGEGRNRVRLSLPDEAPEALDVERRQA